MTSSLRNSIHRRNHKERSQLASRAKFGLLEKHSDYVKRARDYHSKQDRLTRLRQKAAERNKDEFYFSMTKEKTRNGVHVKDRGNTALPTDIVKVLKSQDENYVRTMRMANQKKIDKIKGQLSTFANLIENDQDGLDEDELELLRTAGVLKGSSKKRSKLPQHIIFVDDIADAKTLQTEPEPSKTSNPEAIENRERLLKELSARLARDKQMRYAEREFEMQRLMMGKGARKRLAPPELVEGDRDEVDEDELDARKGKQKEVKRVVDEKTFKPRVYKWKVERKR